MNQRIGIIMLLVTVVAILAAVGCGSSATATPQVQPLPTAKPIKGDPPPVEPFPVEVAAPIEDASVVPPSDVVGDYVLNIISGLPNGCAEFSEYGLEQEGNAFVVSVNNLVPHPSLEMACTEQYGMHEGQISIGSGLVAGETYTVTVNDHLTISFNAMDAVGLAMVEQESPVETVEVSETDGWYTLSVISTLPKGSSCSRFSGYTINDRFLDRIEVSVSHREVLADNVPCTRDLPVVITEIPLGTAFEDGTPYTVVVNGVETNFPSEELAMVSLPAPIESAKLVTPESSDGVYSIDITFGLPSGCAEFNNVEVSRNGNEFVVDVTNLVPNPNEPIACTSIYGYHDSESDLGSGLTEGEAYTVVINGKLTLLFTVPQSDGQAMVEKGPPIWSGMLDETDDGYQLIVASGLPLGSACSKFNGYEINRRFFDRVEVTVTHLEIEAQNVPCTTDYPTVQSVISLGDVFETGRTYTVSVNGEETSFIAR